jgi:uncharacterized protein involved in exopolysaccharide biosynthesis
MTPDLTPNTAPITRHATMREFLVVVFRRRMVILGLFVATTATVLWVALSTPLEYSSSGRVLVRRGEKESVFDVSRQVMGGWEEDLSSELQVVRSHPVMERARQLLAAQAESTGVAAFPIVAKKVDAEVMGKSNVIAIGYSDGDPRVARQVCDAVIRAYIEFRSHELTQVDPRNFFASELAKVKGELDRKVESRRRFTNEAGVTDLPEERRNLLSRLSNVDDREDQANAELAEARTARQRMEDLKYKHNVDLPTFTSYFSNENALVSIKGKVIDQQVRLAQLRERYRDDSPDVVAAANTLDTLRQMLHREVDARLAMWDSRVAMLESRQKVFETDAAALRARLNPMGDKETHIGILDRDIALLKDRYEDLVRRSDQARLNEKTSININLVLLSPPGPALPNNTRDYARLALAPAFSIVVGLGLAFFLDGVDVTVHSPGQAEEAAELPVLAAIRERRRRA